MLAGSLAGLARFLNCSGAKSGGGFLYGRTGRAALLLQISRSETARGLLIALILRFSTSETAKGLLYAMG